MRSAGKGPGKKQKSERSTTNRAPDYDQQSKDPRGEKIIVTLPFH